MLIIDSFNSKELKISKGEHSRTPNLNTLNLENSIGIVRLV
jgi:hypothetical protein